MLLMRKTKESDFGFASQKGLVVVTFALLVVVILAFAALGTDVGLLYSARTSLQRAADSAALAGAFSFIANPSAPQPDTARTQALASATANQVFGAPLLPEEVAVDVNLSLRRVTVQVTRDEPYFFARILGLTEGTVMAAATAEASDEATAAYCTKPWFLPNTILAGSSIDHCQACEDGLVMIQNGELTDLARASIGTLLRIKPGHPSNALAPGQFYALRLPDSSGGNDYRENIERCAPEPIGCRDRYTVEPGNMVGPTLQGVRALIGDEPDQYIQVGRYLREDGSLNDTSKSLVVAPVWDTCGLEGFCPDNELPDSGSNVEVEVIGFAMLFLEGMAGSDVKARLINISACGGGDEVPSTGGIGGDGSAPGPYSLPIRLVRTTG